MQFKESPDQSPELNILVYGKSGSGKTPFSATVQDHSEMAETLFISYEGGHTSISDRDINVLQPEDFDDFDRIYQYLNKHQLLRDKGDDENLLKLHNDFFSGVTKDWEDDDEPVLYNSVVIDSFTEAQLYLKYELLEFDHQKNLTDSAGDMGFDEWGELKERTKRLASNFYSLDMHVVFTALMDEHQNDFGEMVREPALEGAAQKEVPGVFDLLLCMKSADSDDDADSKLLTQSSNGYQARDRFRKLPAVMLDPTIPDIFDTVYNK